MSTVLIKLAGTDITSRVVFSEAEFESAVNGTVGICRLLIRDDDSSYAITTGSALELLIDGDPCWTGYVQQATRTYVFPAINVGDFGATRFWRVEGADINILFVKRIVYTKADPATVYGKLYGPFTADNTVIADLVADYLDLSGDSLDTSTFVENVADINEDQDARAWSGSDTWGQAMSSISLLPAAVFFLDPARNLVYTDVNTATAPYAMSDQPVVGEAGYREMTIALDGTSLANDVLAWGMGYGSNVPVFTRLTDATSLADHGRWQAGIVRSGIYKQATINRVADSIVNGSPSSKRGAKDDRTGVNVVTYTPGFLPAQKVDFTSNIFGFNDVIPIRRMRITFEAPDSPKFELNLSHAVDEPWGFFDPFILKFPKFRLPHVTVPPIRITPGGCTDCGITDPFERAVAAGWGTSDIGLAWYVGNPSDASYFSVSSGNAIVQGTDINLAQQSLFVPSWPLHWTLETRFLVGSISGTSSTSPFRWDLQVDNGRELEVNIAIDGSSGFIQLDGESTAKQFVNFAAGGYFILKWDYDLLTGVAKAKCWHDGVDSEPDWQVEVNYGPGDGIIEALIFEYTMSRFPSWGPYVHTMNYLDISGINRCTYYRFDDFNRTVSLNNTTWGVSSSGPVWDLSSTTNVQYRVGGSVPTVAILPGAEIFKTTGTGTAGAGLQGTTLPAAISGAPTITMTTLVRATPSATNLVEFLFEPPTFPVGTGMVRAVLFVPSAGSVSLRGDPSGPSWVSGSFSWPTSTALHRVLIKWEIVQGVSNKVKAWLEDEAEPSSWLLETTDDTAPGIATDFDVEGVFPSSVGANNTIKWAYIDFDYDGKPCYIGSNIIDDFERSESGQFRTPSRGAPDWTTTLNQSILANGIGSDALVDGFGRSLITLSGTRLSPSNFRNQAGAQFDLDLPEITDLDEFVLAVNLVAAAPSFGSAQTTAAIRFGTASNPLDVTLLLNHYPIIAGDGLIQVRDFLNGTHSTTAGIGTGVFDSTITIDRSVSRGTTIFTVGSLATLTVANGHCTLSASTLFFRFIHTAFYDATPTPHSDISVEASLNDLRLLSAVGQAPGGSFPSTIAGGTFCEIPTQDSSTVFETIYAITVNSIRVWRQGLLQRPGTDYTQTAANKIEFTTAVGTSELVYVCYRPTGGS